MTAPAAMEPTLKEAAEEEAAAAEAEFEALSQGNVEAATPPDRVAEEAEEDQEAFTREAGDSEIEAARQVAFELEARAHTMGDLAVVDALIQIVDIHPDFTIPKAWPGKMTDVHRDSPVLKRIGTILCRGCSQLEVGSTTLLYLWKNKKTWTKDGQPVTTLPQLFNPLTSYLADGAAGAVVGNYQHYRLLNSRQKVAAIYGSLRQISEEGSKLPRHFTGFFDELELFGAGTWEAGAKLQRALEASAGRALPFQVELDFDASGEAEAPESETEAVTEVH